MFDNTIAISKINDFIFCPKSLYFHSIYESFDTSVYHSVAQTNGKEKHENIDKNMYSSAKRYLQGREVYSEKYGLIGKIDIYDVETKTLIERKAKVKKIYDGYKYQLFAQKLCLEEEGFLVQTLKVHSLEDNKNYVIEDTEEDWKKFFEVLDAIQNYNIQEHLNSFQPEAKCVNCIYRELCRGEG